MAFDCACDGLTREQEMPRSCERASKELPKFKWVTPLKAKASIFKNKLMPKWLRRTC